MKIGYPIEVTGDFGKDIFIQWENEAIAWGGFKGKLINYWINKYGTAIVDGKEVMNIIADDWGWANGDEKSEFILKAIGMDDSARQQISDTWTDSSVAHLHINWNKEIAANKREWEFASKKIAITFSDIAKVRISAITSEYSNEGTPTATIQLYKDDYGYIDPMQDDSRVPTLQEQVDGIETRWVEEVHTYDKQYNGNTESFTALKHRIYEPLNMFWRVDLELFDSTGTEISANFTQAELDMMRSLIFLDNNTLFVPEYTFTTAVEQTYPDGVPGDNMDMFGDYIRIGVWTFMKSWCSFIPDWTKLNAIHRQTSVRDEEVELPIDNQWEEETQQQIDQLSAVVPQTQEIIDEIARLQGMLTQIDVEDFRTYKTQVPVPGQPGQWNTILELPQDKLLTKLWEEVIRTHNEESFARDLTFEFNGTRYIELEKIRNMNQDEWAFTLLTRVNVEVETGGTYIVNQFFSFVTLFMSIIDAVVDLLLKIPSVEAEHKALGRGISFVFNMSQEDGYITAKQVLRAAVVIAASFFTFGGGIVGAVAGLATATLATIVSFIISLFIEIAGLYMSSTRAIAENRNEKLRKKARKEARRRDILRARKKEYEEVGINLEQRKDIEDYGRDSGVYLMEPGQEPRIELLNEELLE